MAIKGVDVSHYQGQIDWVKVKNSGYQFAFAKCTEGTSYKDVTYEKNRDGIRSSGLLFGAYHFARLGDPEKEAEWFLKNVGSLNDGEIVVLDFEVDGQNQVEWCLRWLRKVESVLGFKPILYTNEARVKILNWKPVVDGNFGLWVAKYASQAMYVPEYLQRKPISDEWPFWAIWQFSSRGKVSGIVGNVDINTSNMDIQTLKKYGRPHVEECKHCLIHCPK